VEVVPVGVTCAEIVTGTPIATVLGAERLSEVVAPTFTVAIALPEISSSDEPPFGPSYCAWT